MPSLHCRLSRKICKAVVFEANEITAGTITIPAGKTYIYQLAYILKNGEIIDGGCVQFETEKK
jgi:hypothetical protein